MGKIPPPFKFACHTAVPFWNLSLHVLFFKCNNVKEIQTEYHSPYKTRHKNLHLCISVFCHWSMCSDLRCASTMLGQTDVVALVLTE